MPLLPKAILFDFDGTLVEFHHEYLYAQAERILPILDHPPVFRTELELGFSEFDFFRFVLHADREQFIEAFWREFDWNGFPVPQLFPGTRQTLEKLHARGIKNAIVTARNITAEKLRSTVEHTGLLDHIVAVHTRAGDSAHWTDKRATIARACEALGVTPAEVVVVGDIPTDIISAREAGVGKAVAVTSGGITPLVLSRTRPDAIFSDITALPDWINSFDPR